MCIYIEPATSSQGAAPCCRQVRIVRKIFAARDVTDVLIWVVSLSFRSAVAHDMGLCCIHLLAVRTHKDLKSTR